jgi:hypothetical protein
MLKLFIQNVGYIIAMNQFLRIRPLIRVYLVEFVLRLHLTRRMCNAFKLLPDSKQIYFYQHEFNERF